MAVAAQIGDAVDRREVEVLVTHVQVDELARDPDVEGCSLNLIALLRCRARLIETGLFVIGLSRLDLARLSDQEDVSAFDRHLGEGVRREQHIEDATIASTAAQLGATLVSENTKDRARTLRGHPELRVIHVAQFLDEVGGSATAEP